MNGRISKKLRKLAIEYSKHDWKEYLDAIKEWPFVARWRLAWWLLFGKKLKRKKG